MAGRSRNCNRPDHPSSTPAPAYEQDIETSDDFDVWAAFGSAPLLYEGLGLVEGCTDWRQFAHEHFPRSQRVAGVAVAKGRLVFTAPLDKAAELLVIGERALDAVEYS